MFLPSQSQGFAARGLQRHQGTEGALGCLNKLHVPKQIKPLLVLLSGSFFLFPVPRGEAFTHPKDPTPWFNRKWENRRRFSFRFPLCT